MKHLYKLLILALVSIFPLNIYAQDDENLIEIPQTQSPDCGDGANRASIVEGDGYTEYTTKGDISVIIKILDVDVKDCDAIVIKFAEGLPQGICASFAAKSSTANFGLTTGITEYKIDLSDANCDVNNNVLSQITLLTLWNEGKVVKISGVYKHKASTDPGKDPDPEEPTVVYGNSDHKIQVGDLERQYRLYVPKSYDPANATPLVFSLHGAGGHSTDNSPFRSSVADQKGCLVIYPQGVNQNFGPFGITTGWDATGEKNIDYDFFLAAIEDIAAVYNIDRDRIYCCGFSNGGMMTYAMTNAAADVFAAFASISGLQMNEFHFRHTGARPVPFLHIHGKADDFVRYRHMPTISDEMIARSGAYPVPTKTSKSGKYDKSIYPATEGGFSYTYYEVDGMGHNDYTDRTDDGNSALTMWNHFSEYTLSSPCDPTLKWRPNLEAEGYTPKSHGWTSAGKILYMYGKEQKTDANENVYYSLELDNGWHRLSLNSDGNASQQIIIKIKALNGKKQVILNDTIPVGQPANLLFNVTQGYSECQFTITRVTTGTDPIAISGLELHSATEEEITGITTLAPEQKSTSDRKYLDRQGNLIIVHDGTEYRINGTQVK